MQLTGLAAVALATGAVLAQSQASTSEPGEWVEAALDALEVHIQRHPEAEAQDVYKFLFQAALGPGHAVSSRQAADAYLRSEIESLGPSKAAEPPCEPLGGAPAMVRIHLRPFLADGRDPADLVDAFVASAAAVAIDRKRFDRLLDIAPQRLERTGRHRLAGEMRRLAEQMRAEGLPALHHSDAYDQSYDPAYRVILESEAISRGWCAPPPTG